MPRYKASPHKNQDNIGNEKPKWCVCVCGIPDIALGLFDTPEGADAKAQEMLASFIELENWIKNKGAERLEIDTNRSEHIGPIVEIDTFHAIQKLGHQYAVHRVDELDKVPTQNVSSTSIKYRNGRGTVTIRVVEQGTSR